MSENEKIPLSVYATAWDYASELNHGDANHAFNVRDLIAKAIMDERQRCVEIAVSWKGHPVDFPFVGRRVAEAILASPKTPPEPSDPSEAIVT